MPIMPFQPETELEKKQLEGTDVLAVQEATFDDADLKSGLRKVDRRLLPVLGILYLFSYLDRGSLANASIFGKPSMLRRCAETRFQAVSRDQYDSIQPHCHRKCNGVRR